jgi:hypothetical protein
MKKHLIAALVGAMIIFFWQFLSNAALELHRPAQQYTPKQDTIIDFLKSNLAEGRYMIPTLPEGASSEEHEAFMSKMDGKEWAIVDYHSHMEASAGAMINNMIRGLLVNILIVYLFIWILTRGGTPSFKNIFMASILLGFIVFLNSYYTDFIWFKTPGIWQNFTDSIVSWGSAGLWLGWFLNRK